MNTPILKSNIRYGGNILYAVVIGDALRLGYCKGSSSLLSGRVVRSSGNEGPIQAFRSSWSLFRTEISQWFCAWGLHRDPLALESADENATRQKSNSSTYLLAGQRVDEYATSSDLAADSHVKEANKWIPKLTAVLAQI